MVLYGEDPVRLRAAGEEALEEIVRLDAQLSLFNPASEISEINARAYEQSVRVDPRLVRLLKRLAELSRITHGAFDPTVGPLMRCWRFRGDAPADAAPRAEEVQAVLDCVGMAHVHIDEDNSCVRFSRPGMSLDLGAMGKGYAIDRAVACLRELGIGCAFIHGGTSTSYGLGTPPEAEAWSVGVDCRDVEIPARAVFGLRDAALSVSAPHGREVLAGGRRYGHVIDPRSGQPVQGTLTAAVSADSGTEAEVFSTALLVLGPDWLSELGRIMPRAEALVVRREGEGEIRAYRLTSGQVTSEVLARVF